MERGCIEIRGARQNNLKGFDLDLPLGQLTVVTGPSGSGKSSLAFDTIYAEGQRRYVETFSPYTRQFLERMDKPRVDEIRGIPPAIAIEQSNPVKSSRSTVGTMTEINDYLKLLLPRVARAFCPSCGREIRPETAKSIAEEVLRQFEGHSSASPSDDALRLDARKRVPPEGPASASPGASVLITFWVSVPPKTEPSDFFGFLQQQGYLRVWLNGEVVRADGETKKIRLGARVQVIQDRLTITEENRARLVESIETALRFGKDKINFIDLADEGGTSLLHRLALRALRPRHSSADARALQFQQSAGRVSGVSRLRPHHRDRSQPRHSRSRALHRAGRGARFPRRGNGRIAKGFAPRLRPRGDRRSSAVRGIAETRPGFRHQRRERRRRIHRGRLRERSLVRRPGLLPMAREQDLQNACARFAQPLPRLHHLPELSGRPLSTGDAQLPASQARRNCFHPARVRRAADRRGARFSHQPGPSA